MHAFKILCLALSVNLSLMHFYLDALPHVVLLGCPGAGKGTLSQMLQNALPEYIHIGSGDMLREEIRKNTDLGNKIKKIIDTDEIIPDALIIEMTRDRLLTVIKENKKFILEGFPHTLTQLHFLEDFLKSLHLDNVHFFHIVIDPQDAINRILTRKTCSQCGATYSTKTNIPIFTDQCNHCHGQLITRSDDNEIRAQQRVQSYSLENHTILDFYTQQDKLIIVDGNKEINGVFNAFKEYIKNRL